MKRKLMTKRERARRVRLRRVPIDRLYLELADFLETIGWRALVMSNARVKGFGDGKYGRYEFSVDFSGGKI